MRILNLHGFMGEADNKNYKALCEIFPVNDIISPQIEYMILRRVNCLNSFRI